MGAIQGFGSLQVLLSSLPLSKGGLGITRASDIFSLAFLSSHLNSLDLQSGLLASAMLPPNDAAVACTLTSAPDCISSAYA